MAKRYDPILCMLVDEPTKAQDELKIKKEDGLWCVYKDGKVVGQSNSEAGAIRIYNRLESANKANDAEFQMYGPEFHHPIIKASSKEEAIKKAKEIYGWGGKVEAVKVSDSASALDKAIKACDAASWHIKE